MHLIKYITICNIELRWMRDQILHTEDATVIVNFMEIIFVFVFCCVFDVNRGISVFDYFFFGYYPSLNDLLNFTISKCLSFSLISK